MSERRGTSLGPDLVFAALFASGLIASMSWLNDPGTGWHLRLGREILATGSVPRSDTLTYTQSGTAWVDQSWLFDAALAGLVDHGGWSLTVVLAAFGVSLIYRGLASQLEAAGISPLSAVTTAVLAAGVGSVHFLIRPHLVTLGMVAWTFHACREHHRVGSRRIWSIPPLMIVWANCHGGFLAGPILLATAMVGNAVSGPMDGERRAKVRDLALVLGLTVGATLVTPYGFDLYRHVFKLLMTSGVTELIDEYQPSPFGRPKARVLEWVVLGLVALPSLSGRRIGRYDLAQGLVWLHFALGSLRQAPLFALAIAPAFGLLCDGAFSVATAGPAGRRGRPIGPAVALAAALVALVAGWSPGRLDPVTWPLDGLSALDAQASDAPLFHEQDWGGLIEAATAPRRRAFIDDRFELFGRGGIFDYLAILEGGAAWDEAARRHGLGLAWVRPHRGLARRLRSDPGWRVVHEDGVSVLFARPSTR